MKEEAKSCARNRQPRKMLKAALEAQESERRRLAKDLQDNLGMMLMTMRVSLNRPAGWPGGRTFAAGDKTHESVQRMSWG